MAEYITLSEVVRMVSEKAEKDGNEISNKNKIREKYTCIFDMMDIDREKLKNGNDYRLPVESKDFLVDLYWMYSDADVKKMRKGLFEQSSLETIERMLNEFRKLILRLEISDEDKDTMIAKMFLRTKYPYLKKRAEILDAIENIKLDFYPDYKEDEKIDDELEKFVKENGFNMRESNRIESQRRFRYFGVLDDLDVNDEVLFSSFVLEDINCMIRRHHEIYYYIKEIRTCEINDAAERKATCMSEEEEIEAVVDVNNSIKLQKALDANMEYNDLLDERKKILRSNDFVSKLQPRFAAIQERLSEIDAEEQMKMWGEILVKDDTDEEIDFSFRKSSEDVFEEALASYRDDNKGSRDYRKKMEMISEEEKERFRELIQELKANRKSSN